MRPRLIVDCQGGDRGPAVTVPAIAPLVDQAELTLVGDADAIGRALRSARISDSTLALIDRPNNATLDHGLRALLRSASGSAQGYCLSQLAAGAGDAVVSAADTGALLTLSRHLVGTVDAIDRPALTKQLVGKSGTFWMTDLGANVRCTPELLVQFGQMGIVAARTFSKVERPRVALLNIGTEASKGLARLKEAAAKLERLSYCDYVGFVEGSALFDNSADVIVCEGFVGNVALKAVEGTAAMAKHLMQQQLGAVRGWRRPLLALLDKPFAELRAALDTGRYNGAPILGLKRNVIKSHGAADSRAFAFALQRGIDAARVRLPETLAEGLAVHPSS